MTEDQAVEEANRKQRTMTDEEVMDLWVSWGNEKVSNLSVSLEEYTWNSIESIREILTNHFYDELMGYD